MRNIINVREPYSDLQADFILAGLTSHAPEWLVRRRIGDERWHRAEPSKAQVGFPIA